MAKILIVDDDPGILEALKLMLEEEGYSVDTSPTPDLLFSLKPKQYPSLILLDVLLSGNDGREVCKKLKSKKGTKNIPIILISAAPKIEQSVKNAKADGFLSKPFEVSELVNLVKEHLN